MCAVKNISETSCTLGCHPASCGTGQGNQREDFRVTSFISTGRCSVNFWLSRRRLFLAISLPVPI